MANPSDPRVSASHAREAAVQRAIDAWIVWSANHIGAFTELCAAMDSLASGAALSPPSPEGERERGITDDAIAQAIEALVAGRASNSCDDAYWNDLEELVWLAYEQGHQHALSLQCHPEVADAFAALAAARPSPEAEPSDAAAEAFLAEHYKAAPFSKSGIMSYPHPERVEWVKAWLRAAYAVDFPRAAQPQREDTP